MMHGKSKNIQHRQKKGVRGHNVPRKSRRACHQTTRPKKSPRLQQRDNLAQWCLAPGKLLRELTESQHLALNFRLQIRPCLYDLFPWDLPYKGPDTRDRQNRETGRRPSLKVNSNQREPGPAD